MLLIFFSNFGHLLAKTYKKFLKDRCPLLAQALTHSTMFSLFPLLFGVISISVYIVGSSESIIDKLLPMLEQVFPKGIDTIVRSVTAVKQTSVVLAFLGFIFFLWGVGGIFRTVETSLNVVWGDKDDRPFIKKSLLTMLFALLLFILFTASIALTFYASAAGIKFFRFVSFRSPIITLIISINIFALTYKFAPIHEVKFSDAYIGGLFTGFFWELAKVLFTLYITKVVNYQQIYGSLSAIIILYLWVFYSAYIFLFGAELSYTFANRKEILGF
ncbi:MAG: YihY/virulence factor BrkB family protein, partial [candidate division WOR-3 bacterium]